MDSHKACSLCFEQNSLEACLYLIPMVCSMSSTPVASVCQQSRNDSRAFNKSRRPLAASVTPGAAQNQDAGFRHTSATRFLLTDSLGGAEGFDVRGAG